MSKSFPKKYNVQPMKRSDYCEGFRKLRQRSGGKYMTSSQKELYIELKKRLGKYIEKDNRCKYDWAGSGMRDMDRFISKMIWECVNNGIDISDIYHWQYDCYWKVEILRVSDITQKEETFISYMKYEDKPSTLKRIKTSYPWAKTVRLKKFYPLKEKAKEINSGK